MSDATPPESAASRLNRLSLETSPYLRQHQHNPVDWHPWGPEAFETARKLNRPIFLSVGYSTCYWCHVMERQCFENPSIAAEMNRRVVSVKVDREERPDVDQLYMTAVQLLTHQGGWPMSVFLTPDLRPFYGGTYFPPTDQYGRPGFPTLLKALGDAFRNRAGDVESTAEQVLSVLRRLAEPAPPERSMNIDPQFIGDLIDRSIGDYDRRHGGFGTSPKFPRQTLLELLLTYLATQDAHSTAADNQRRENVRQIVLHTLEALSLGGIRDHLGGGFHRYSTDTEWLVPHFEIMLYDNAMLAWCYVEAFRQTKDARWAQVARGILDFVLREMTSSHGAFFTAFDAEVDAMEGMPYLWTADEVEDVLLLPTAIIPTDNPANVPASGGMDDVTLFKRVYGLDKGPNFVDPHHGSGSPDKNVLYLPRSLEKVSAETGIDLAVLSERLALARGKLRAARASRKQPLLDTKILTSWNALMIRAFAHAGLVLEQPAYVVAAVRAAEFLLENHFRPSGELLRTSGGVKSASPSPREPIGGFLDDYSFFAQAVLALAKADDPQRWTGHARQIVSQMLARFGEADGTRGFFFTDAAATDLIVRQKTGSDSPLPSGNAVAAMVLSEIGREDAALGTIRTFTQAISAQGEAMSAMVQAALLLVQKSGAISVAAGAGPDRPATPEQLAADAVATRADWTGTDEIWVNLVIREGFHLSAHQTDPAIPMIPTTLTIVGADASVEYPPGEEKTLAFTDRPVHVYSGEISLRVRLAAPDVGKDAVQLFLSYQACDDSACLAPVKKRIELHG
jgi:uncharacterized protein YyaL (SSP411 family)